MKSSLLVILALLVGSVSKADVSKIKADQEACLNKAMSTYDMNHCNDLAISAADAELNKTYTKLRVSLNGSDENSKETLKRLRASEKAWIAYRDTNCSLQGIQMLGGSGEGPIIGGCLASITIERVKELQTLFESK